MLNNRPSPSCHKSLMLFVVLSLATAFISCTNKPKVNISLNNSSTNNFVSPSITSSTQPIVNPNAVAFTTQTKTQTSDTDNTLELGKSIERELKGGEVHNYQLKLTANQYLNAVVEQKGVDVIVAIYAPDGQKIYEINYPNDTDGPEPVYLIAASEGNYKLEVRASGQKAPVGKYQAKIVEIRDATQSDKPRVSAYKALGDAISLQAEAKPEAANQVITKYQEAIKLSQDANEPLAEAPASNNLGTLYQNKGDYTNAEILLKQALALYEKALGSDATIVADASNNLALLYKIKGNLVQSELLYKRALAIYEKTLGSEHLNIAASYNNLGLLYFVKGDYVNAEPLLKRALAIVEKVFGSEHPNVASACSNIGVFYQTKGDYINAELLQKRSLAIREKVLGPEHPFVAFSCTNLASVYKDKGDYDNAELLQKRALAITEKALGPEHPNVVAICNSLAYVYQYKGDYANAEPLLKRALELGEKILGSEHPNVANSCYGLGIMHKKKGDYASAEPLLKRVLAIREKILGLGHPDVAGAYTNLGVFYQAKGDITEAINYNKKGNESREKEFLCNLASGSEKQKLLYINKTNSEQDVTISLNLQTAPKDLQAAQSAMTVILRRKGRALDAISQNIEALRRRANPEDKKLLDELASKRAYLAKVTLAGKGKDTPEVYQAKLKDLNEELEKLESEIGNRSAEFRIQNLPINLENVQKAIPADSALIEFTIYRPYEAKADKYGARRYAAYTLENNGELKWVDLGEEEAIDKAVSEFRDVLVKKGNEPLSNITKELKPKARAIDKLVMEPIRKLITGKKHLLIAPDGALNLIPFDAFVDEKEKYLVESYEISYLTSGRDLLRLQSEIKSQSQPMIMADPDYGQGSGPVLLGEKFQPLSQLSATEIEGSEIKATLANAELKTKQEVTKDLLKGLNSPQFLHIATHGYFLQDQQEATSDARVAKREKTFSSAENEPINVEESRKANPLLKSYLFLTGANNSQTELDKDSDGVITALEVTSLNLYGTKLVVLSACDTGLGEVKSGDGVYGLRRALVLAGSETQMMSLWSVNDASTKELMVNYYKLLKKGENRSGALRKVQLSFINGTSLTTNSTERLAHREKISHSRQSNKSINLSHPYYWASFIQSGEWATLDGKR